MSATPRTDSAYLSMQSAESKVDALLACSEQLETELAQAKEELDDWHNAAKAVDADIPDEVHCGCVPILRKQLKDARVERDYWRGMYNELLGADKEGLK